MIPFVLCFVLNIADGVLTYMGVQQFGLEMEGNPLVRWAVAYAGLFWGLAFGKIYSAVLIVVLWWGENYFWLWTLNAIFLFIAVIPWVSLLVFGI